MNFQYLIPVERSKAYLNLAFGKAREKSNKKLEGEWLDKIRKREMIKLDVVKDQLVSRLDKVLNSFPSLSSLPRFYLELIKLTLDYGELKKALAGVSWAINKIRLFHKEYVRKISKGRGGKEIKEKGNEFYGRISSIIKQIDRQLFFLEESRKVMKRYPDVKEMFTAVIFGFPNVGKTTLLNKLTGAQGEVASYAFTTTGINSGYWEADGAKVQVLDVPGTLNRIDKMNDIEKIAYLAVKELADVVVYVFDLSGQSGYPIKKQEQLFKSLKEEKKVLIYLSKKDLMEPEEISKFKHKHLTSEEIKEELIKLFGLHNSKN